MFTIPLKLWKQLPQGFQEKIYQILKPTGIPYFVSYVAKYKEAYQLSNFAGNIMLIKEEYQSSAENRRKNLLDQYDAILDNLVMKNGVKKTTYPRRQGNSLSKIFDNNNFRIEKDTIDVLDVPSSTGAASLGAYEILRKNFTIRSYILGDLYFNVYYDRNRECIYDEDGNLLQVKFTKQFFSIYRPHTSGNVFNIITYSLLSPLSLLSWYLKRRYPFRGDANCYLISLIHPDVEYKLRDGGFSIRKIDVFQRIEGRFDVIISFNLLQKNYFPISLIQIGIENLKNALNEDGLLIMGNTESFSLYKKKEGELLLITKEGEF
jgi:hypothetical protein